VWSDGNTLGYSNWNTGEPNNSNGEDCGFMYGSGSTLGKWNDYGCEYSFQYACRMFAAAALVAFAADPSSP